MRNFREEIVEAAGGERIEGVVIGVYWDASDWGSDSLWDLCPAIPWDRREIVLSWEEAAPLLEYEHDGGWGTADCHAIYAWTGARVLFVHEYDGSTHVHHVPRHPVACRPEMSGEYQ